MKVAIYQNDNGSAPAIHWWLSQELNIGPKLYEFDNGFCRPDGNHVGAVVIEDTSSQYHEEHLKSLAALSSPANAHGIVDVFSLFKNINEFDTLLWSNYFENLHNIETVISADKTILVDNSPEEVLFFYITQYAFSKMTNNRSVDHHSEIWWNDHRAGLKDNDWNEIWYKEFHNKCKEAYDDGSLQYMWQLNFMHSDLKDYLDGKKDFNEIKIYDVNDVERLFAEKKQAFESINDTIFHYANNEVDHLVVGDNWFEDPKTITDYIDSVPSFRLKKFLAQYKMKYQQKKDLYTEKFAKYI